MYDLEVHRFKKYNLYFDNDILILRAALVIIAKTRDYVPSMIHVHNTVM